MDRLEELKKAIENFDISEHVTETDFDDWLDEIHPVVDVCGYKYMPSKVLKTVDRIAYDDSFNNYIDSLDCNDIEAYKELLEELEEEGENA